MDDSVGRFWGKFTERSRSYGINPENTQACITHANQFILQADGKRLATHNAADIETGLTDKGRNPELNDACFCEIALSLKILFVAVVCSDWTLNFNWQTAKSQIQTQFPELFKHLITEIRVRQYSD